ncbi:MAG: hypothetical protein H6591_03935 [Flavobacteriales bacterium]|nr:hypothetical protein [Flavobacteriales bacterium]
MTKPKLPRDPNQRAKRIADIATGEEALASEKDTRNPAAVALGKMGGKARAKSLSASKRKAIAKKAAQSRWENRSSK